MNFVALSVKHITKIVFLSFDCSMLQTARCFNASETGTSLQVATNKFNKPPLAVVLGVMRSPCVISTMG